MKARLRYRSNGVTVDHHDYQRITDARKDAKIFAKNPEINMIWISVWDGWDWRIKEILKESE